jgi:N-acetylneuraminic acid mutarotase
LRAFIKINPTVGFVPAAREGVKLVSILDSKGKLRLYHFGGFSVLNQMITLCSYDWKWKECSKSEGPQQRRNFVMVARQEKIYIHGGGGEFKQSIKTQETFKDIWEFDTKTC